MRFWPNSCQKEKFRIALSTLLPVVRNLPAIHSAFEMWSGADEILWLVQQVEFSQTK